MNYICLILRQFSACHVQHLCRSRLRFRIVHHRVASRSMSEVLEAFEATVDSNSCRYTGLCVGYTLNQRCRWAMRQFPSDQSGTGTAWLLVTQHISGWQKDATMPAPSVLFLASGGSLPLGQSFELSPRCVHQNTLLHGIHPPLGHNQESQTRVHTGI